MSECHSGTPGLVPTTLYLSRSLFTELMYGPGGQVLSPASVPPSVPSANASCPAGSWLTGCSCVTYGSDLEACVAARGSPSTGTIDTCFATSQSSTLSLAAFARCQRRDFCRILGAAACGIGGLCKNLGQVGTGYHCECKPG